MSSEEKAAERPGTHELRVGIWTFAVFLVAIFGSFMVDAPFAGLAQMIAYGSLLIAIVVFLRGLYLRVG